MSTRRISYSLLDPVIGPRLRQLYPHLHIPRRFPPEGIVAIGHLSAMAAAAGFAFSTTTWWGGLLAAAGVVGNHLADCVDGTHARATGQCRNGGELLDHFTDPLSFAYILIGISVGLGRLDLGLIAVVGMFAVAVLTNIKAKMLGEFTLARFGPTEFKTVLVGLGVLASISTNLWGSTITVSAGTVLAHVLIGLALIQLPIQLWQAVREVNQRGRPADTSEWETVSENLHNHCRGVVASRFIDGGVDQTLRGRQRSVLG